MSESGWLALAGLATTLIGTLAAPLITAAIQRRRRAEARLLARRQELADLLGKAMSVIRDLHPDALVNRPADRVDERMATLHERWESIRPGLLAASIADLDTSLREQTKSLETSVEGLLVSAERFAVMAAHGSSADQPRQSAVLSYNSCWDLGLKLSDHIQSRLR